MADGTGGGQGRGRGHYRITSSNWLVWITFSSVLTMSQCLHLHVTQLQTNNLLKFVSYTETRAHQDLMVYVLYSFWPFGNLGIDISASASTLASTLASALQKFYFCLTNCFMKNYVKYTQIFFLALSFAASVSFRYSYSFR